jgi:hypothetical protein
VDGSEYRFPRGTWLRLLEEVGFTAESHPERLAGERQPRDLFVGRRPG